MKRVLVLQDVIQAISLGKLDRPAVAIRQLRPGLGPGLASSEDLIFLLLTATTGGNTAELDRVIALILPKLPVRCNMDCTQSEDLR